MRSIYAICFGLALAIMQGCANTMTITEALRNFRTMEDIKFGEIVRQERDYTCGLGSLRTIMRFHFGDEIPSEAEMIERYERWQRVQRRKIADVQGFSLLQLEAIGRLLAYKTRRKVFSFSELEQSVSFVPVIVHLHIGKQDHFAVVRGIDNDLVLLADPSRGNTQYSRKEFMREWSAGERDGEEIGIGLILIGTMYQEGGKLLRKPVGIFAGIRGKQ